MRFPGIDKVLLFGGSPLIVDLAIALRKRGLPVRIFSSPRQMAEKINPNGATLEETLNKHAFPILITEDINREVSVLQEVGDQTFGFGIGEAWSFSSEIIEKFDGRLLDIMGIPLPLYRGGAHYSWMIMQGEKRGACCLQEVNAEMIQGVRDTGSILKRKDYHFPVTAKIPADYFEYAGKMELQTVNEFIDEVQHGKVFLPVPVPQEGTLYFPRLNTLEHGFINWSWSTEDLFRFICAFDEPYAGAQTFIRNQQIHLKDVVVDPAKITFHPFQYGLVTEKTKHSIKIATEQGLIVTGKIIDHSGKNILESVSLGNRFYTPVEVLAKAMAIQVTYGPKGYEQV